MQRIIKLSALEECDEEGGTSVMLPSNPVTVGRKISLEDMIGNNYTILSSLFSFKRQAAIFVKVICYHLAILKHGCV